MGMTALLTLVGYGAAVAAAVALSFTMGWRHPSFRLALMIAGFWIIGNLSDAWMDPFIDAVGFYAAILVWWAAEVEPTEDVDGPAKPADPSRWALVLALAFLAQQLVHFLFSDGQSFSRQAWINALFAVEIIAVCFPGAHRTLQRCGLRRPSGDPSGGAAVVVRAEKS